MHVNIKMLVPGGGVLVGAALLHVTTGASAPRGFFGSSSGNSGGSPCNFWCPSGGGQYHCCETPGQAGLSGDVIQRSGAGSPGGSPCLFWCPSGGGEYHCCETPQQSALRGGGDGHLAQTPGGSGVQGIGQQPHFSAGLASQGVNNFGNAALVTGEVVRPVVKTNPFQGVHSQSEAKCGISTSFELTIRTGELNNTERIVGGQKTMIGKFPWMVHLRFFIGFGHNAVRCGGSLISNKWILTAAHCIRFLEKETPVFVRIGSVNLNKKEPQSVQFSIFHGNFIPHPEFDFNATSPNWIHDIALARVPENVQLNSAIKPICLADNRKIPFGGKAVAAGWGLQDPDDTEIPDILREVKLDVLGDSSCRHPRNFICTSAAAGKDTCKGDSGGPLMVQEGRQWFIIGIVSNGPENCGRSDVPGAYTRVPNYLQFIKHYTNL